MFAAVFPVGFTHGWFDVGCAVWIRASRSPCGHRAGVCPLNRQKWNQNGGCAAMEFLFRTTEVLFWREMNQCIRQEIDLVRLWCAKRLQRDLRQEIT